MYRIEGKYNTALCYAKTLDERAEEQIREVCSQKAFAGSKIRIMPDVHAGKGCTIGTTMTIRDKVVPGMVGVDIGCGMETVLLKGREIDFDRLDGVIREKIPSGHSVRSHPHELNREIDLDALRCAAHVNLQRARLSIGTLGGGNHFIEVDKDDEGRLYLVIHSGSRNLGKQVAEHYQKEGRKALKEKASKLQGEIDDLIAAGRKNEIEDMIRHARQETPASVPPELTYVEGALFDDYIHDMRLTQRYAALNRQAMVDTILGEMGLQAEDAFTTIHNYIDTDAMILRKGAVSARKGERLLIPINMRDGSLICIGKGNEEWNQSAPHGAGRLMSRSMARQALTMEAYRQQMQGIYTSCVTLATLDESPMAYKPMEEIMQCIEPAAVIERVIRPVYNFKAAE